MAVRCPLCHEVGQFKKYYSGFPTLYKCSECSFVFQDEKTIKTNYEDSYNLDFTNKSEWMYPARRDVLMDITRRIKQQTGPGKILDIGCGDGHFLYLCKNEGFDISGVEYDRNLSEYANKKAGNVLPGKYDKQMFPENYFDVITMIQVLEHIPEPQKILEIAKYHLKPDGIIVIEVPSIHAPHFLLYNLTRMKKFVNNPRGIIHSHCNYFSVRTLTRLLNDCGFIEHDLVTGRWKHKYGGTLKKIATFTDPIMNMLKIGGILYIGRLPVK